VTDETEPAFRVVRGSPTDEELAALVAVLFARRATPVVTSAAAPSRWRAAALPGPGSLAGSGGWRTGPGAWRAAGLPTGPGRQPAG
jgi:hypothetical protein